jgi:hypothetical protein
MFIALSTDLWYKLYSIQLFILTLLNDVLVIELFL